MADEVIWRRPTPHSLRKANNVATRKAAALQKPTPCLPVSLLTAQDNESRNAVIDQKPTPPAVAAITAENRKLNA